MGYDWYIEQQREASVSVGVPSGVDKMFDNIQNELLPTIEVIIKDYLNDIVDNAKKNWLVRRTKSRNSANKFEIDVYVEDNAQAVFGIIRNNAPYAYAIKSGRKSRTSNNGKSIVSTGDRIWEYLVQIPTIEAAPEIQEKITDSILILQQEIPF